MKKKFFTLIKGDQIHISPGEKRIPSSEYLELINGKELIDRIEKEVHDYRLEIAKESELIKEQAYKEGFEAGFQKWTGFISNLEQEIMTVREDLKKVVVPAALKGAQKILGRELSLSQDAIVDIVKQSLKSVAQHKKITIFVSPEDFANLEKNKEKLKKLFEELDSFTLIPREDISRGGCIIETEGGIINAELPNLWIILEKAFEKLLK